MERGPRAAAIMFPNNAQETAEPMKVLVPVKRVVDYNVKVRVKADGTGVKGLAKFADEHQIAE